MGYLVAHVGIFYLAAVTALAAIVAIYAICEADIDHAQARGRDTPDQATGSAWDVLTNPRLLVYASAVVLFHFANAAMLPLVGQDLAAGRPEGAALYMAACVIVAQLVMMPVAAGTGHAAVRFGRRPLYLLALACLPIRAAVFALSDNPGVLLAAQILDGIANGIFGVVNVLVIADLTRGSGRYNITLGVVATAIGIGAALSNGVSGFIVDALGYSGAFAVLGGIAVLAWLMFFVGVPETVHRETAHRAARAAGPG